MKGKMFDVDKLIKRIKKKQETINKNSKKLKTLPKSILVGWDSKSGTYPEQNGKPVWYVAKIHELGLGNQTEKAMVKNTVFLHESQWIKMYTKEVARQSKRDKVPDYYGIIEAVGRQMKDDLKSYLYAIDLVDTSRLANSIITRYRRRR